MYSNSLIFIVGTVSLTSIIFIYQHLKNKKFENRIIDLIKAHNQLIVKLEPPTAIVSQEPHTVIISKEKLNEILPEKSKICLKLDESCYKYFNEDYYWSEKSPFLVKKE